MIPTNIQRTQRERLACVYVRQSTQLQVRQHQESAERQYALQQRAVALGWPPSAIEVIDEDQGRSGATAAHRSGFQRLVSGVGLGQVGLVLMLEASRLAQRQRLAPPDRAVRAGRDADRRRGRRLRPT